MIAVLSTAIFDPQGWVELDVEHGTTLDPLRRRVNRVATLDTRAVFNDMGFSELDRTITLRWRVRSAAEEASVARLVRLYARLRLAMADAVYLVAPELYTPGSTESELVLLVAERLTD